MKRRSSKTNPLSQEQAVSERFVKVVDEQSDRAIRWLTKNPDMPFVYIEFLSDLGDHKAVAGIEVGASATHCIHVRSRAPKLSTQEKGKEPADILSVRHAGGEMELIDYHDWVHALVSDDVRPGPYYGARAAELLLDQLTSLIDLKRVIPAAERL